jgi:hypothetical protein
MITPGLYRHFKGAYVRVLFTALDSETEKPLIVYMHLDDGIIWVREETMFHETVTRGTFSGPRFTRIEQV